MNSPNPRPFTPQEARIGLAVEKARAAGFFGLAEALYLLLKTLYFGEEA